MFNLDDGILFKYGALINYKVNKMISIDLPVISFYVPVTGVEDRKNQFVIGGGINFTF